MYFSETNISNMKNTNTKPRLELVDCDICLDLRSVIVEENHEGDALCPDCYAENPKLLWELLKTETNKTK